MSRVMRKPVFAFLTRSDPNRAVQRQRLESLDLESGGIVLSL